MMNNETSNPHTIRTIGIGGAAGDGVREAGVHFGEFAQRIGCHAFLAFYYPSLIRGGHNFARVSFSPEKVHADHGKLDVMIAITEDDVRIRKPELSNNAMVIVESTRAEATRQIAENVFALPMLAITKELNAPHAAMSSVAVGALAYIVGLERDEFATLAPTIFSDLVGGREINCSLAMSGYDVARTDGFPIRPEMRSLVCVGQTGELVEGNKSVALGLLSAGLEFYVGYPMTPSTSVLTFLAKEASQGKLKVVQPEDEIAVMTMALGISYAGVRTAVGTANGGFALMEEAFSLAGISELPVVAVVSQRQGPATGVATHTSQSDLRFIIHAGHGEFPRFVTAPGDVEECFQAGQMALNLAWKYQIPAIVLLDKHISESHATSTIDMKTQKIDLGSRSEEGETDYKRFKFTDSGVSPLTFPGTPGAHVKATSYEHNEFGSSVDMASDVQAMQDKRWRKQDGLRSEFAHYDTVKVTGDTGSETAVVFWGSTKGAVLEAGKMLQTPIRFVQVIWMEPFDEAAVEEALRGAKRVVVVEGNHGAQLAGLIREKTGILATDTISKYDAEPFEPYALAEELRRRFGDAS